MNAPEAFVTTLDHIGRGVSLRQSALAFAASGVPVFPCTAGGKRPAVAGGFLSASSEPESVHRWWAAMPSANIGMPTGAATGLVVVDVDVHSSVNGYDALDGAQRAGLLEGWEAAVRTPSGGLHLFFPADRNSEQRSWQSARTGIDFRGDGGYVIVPPSERTLAGLTHRYEILQLAGGPGRPLDSQQLHDYLDPPQRNEARRSPRSAQQPVDVQRLADWVARLQEGERNHGLFWAACKMAEQMVPNSEALDALSTAAEQAGLSQREAATTVRSAYRAVQGASPQRSIRANTKTSCDRPPPASHPRALA
ncbi:MAG: bifunctional DNA primase/polymerase [Actinomycetales bacterium]